MPQRLNGTSYEITGPSEAPVIVLIHGLGLTCSSTFGAMIPVLARRFRVLSYDLCGHGETALPTEKPSLDLLARQVIQLMDGLGIEQAALVGFSLGGMINRRVAMDNPGRVSSLVVLNSPHERGEEAQRLVEERARDTSAGGPRATIDATLERWFTREFRRDHPDQVAAIKDVVMANDHANYAQHRQVLAEGVVELIRPEPPISHPTLVMTCENDTGSTPDMSRAIAREIAGAEIRIEPGLQHLGLIEQPALFAEVVMDFLGRTIGQEQSTGHSK